MTLTKTFPTQDAAGLPITDTRRVMSGLVTRNADGTPRPGVFPASDAPIVTGRASMGYNVAPFLAALARFNNGVELVANDASMIVNTTAAPASNSRIDVIWVRARFVQHADGSNLPEIGVTQGVAAAIPTKPAIPAGALELATAEILSTTTTTATAVITQTAPYTTAAGGVVWFRSKTEQDGYSAPEGTEGWRLDQKAPVRFQGGAWRPVNRTAVFTLAINGFSDNTLASTAIPTTPKADETTDSSFITARQGTVCTVTAGLYIVALHFELASPASFTGRTFAEVAVGGPVVARNNAQNGVGENAGGVTTLAQVMADGTQISPRIFKVSGGAPNVSGRLTITKLA